MSHLDKKYWQLTAEQVLADLKVTQSGLDFLSVQSRLAQYRKNEISAQHKRPAYKIFLDQFKSPLVLILLAASLIAGFLGDAFSTLIIILIILVNSVLAFYQEFKSELAIDRLRQKVSLKATVLRDGKTKLVSATTLVPGDIVYLGLGRAVPADLRLIECDDLTINESMITGEAFPAEKNTAPLALPDYLPQAMSNLAFMGTHVAQGSGRGVVIATGKNTELGRTAHLLTAKPRETEFQKGIKDFGAMLFKVILLFTFLIFVFLAAFKHDVGESLLFALAIAVGISPELLPVIITLNLSHGATNMAKKKVIVKRLMSIEDIGNVDVLCTDKTGTLTQGKISLKGFYDLKGEIDYEILRSGWLCNSMTVAKDFVGNSLDEAIIVAGQKNKIKGSLTGCRIIDSISFDFKRRRMSVIVDCEDNRRLICKGAVEEMLAVVSRVKLDGKVVAKKTVEKRLRQLFSQVESEGNRILLVATKEIAVKNNYSPEDEDNLILSGYLVFSDSPKTSAKKSLLRFTDLGVEVKILTGDSPEAAMGLYRLLSEEEPAILTGEEISKLNPSQLAEKVGQIKIFAKITPEHKLMIVNALKEQGHTVGFLGDGVNDAPALRAADVGISVDTAIDVAKEAADIVLLEKNLEVLCDGIVEGRKTFGNTLKYIFSTISSNYGNMFSVAGAAIFLPYIPMLPTQILLLNFLSDIPMLAIASDRVDEDYLKKPKHWDVKMIGKVMSRFGVLSSLFDFITFGLLLYFFRADSSLFQTGWFWESFLTEVAIVYIIRTKRWFWKSVPARALVLSGLGGLLAVLFFIYGPFSSWFHFTPLPWPILITMLLVTAAYFLVVELVKQRFYKKYDF